MRVLRSPAKITSTTHARRFRPVTRIQHRTTNAWGSALLWLICFGMIYGAFVALMLYAHKHL